MLDIEKVLGRLKDAMKQARVSTSSGAVRAAIALVEDLRVMSHEQRLLALRNSQRYRTIAVAIRLLEVARDAAADSPDEGLLWLDLFEVLAGAESFDQSDFEAVAIESLAALSIIRRAVTLIKKGDHLRAEMVLRIASALELVEPEMIGELHEARALLLSLRLKLPEALSEIAQAKTLYAEICDEHLVGRAIAAEAFAYGESRRYGEAVELWLAACEKLDARRDHRLTLAACFNLARCLRDAGRPAEALVAVSMSRDFFQAKARRSDQRKLQWLEAGLLADTGQFSAAATTYLEVVEGFAADAMPLEVAAAALEAVEAFERVQRTRELVPLIATAIEIFRSLRLDEEAIASWIALRDAAARSAVTAAVLRAARAAVSAT